MRSTLGCILLMVAVVCFVAIQKAPQVELQAIHPTVVTFKAAPGATLRCIVRTFSGNLTIDRKVLHITIPIAEVFPAQNDTLLVPLTRGELTCTSHPTTGRIGESPYASAGRY